MEALAALDRLYSQLKEQYADVDVDTEEELPSSPQQQTDDDGFSFWNLFSSSGTNSRRQQLLPTYTSAYARASPKGVYLHGGVGCGKSKYCYYGRRASSGNSYSANIYWVYYYYL
jgi:predicted ATPase